MKKSILVGDIGSTKSTWWYDLDGNQELHLKGYHPLIHAKASGSELFGTLSDLTRSTEFSDIWYYGTGVIDLKTADQIRSGMRHFFPKSNIHVGSDLLGAVKAACGDQEGTVAILGTGSHAAVHDGRSIVRQATALGYILGDEGGGCDLGKGMLQAYFYGELPEELAEEMSRRLPQGRAGVLQELQSSPTPNQWLAGFAEVAVQWKEDAWVRSYVKSRFKIFVKRHIVPLKPIGSVHIVGSIGCIFGGLIQQELEEVGLKTGQFIQNPSRRLFEIHMEHD